MIPDSEEPEPAKDKMVAPTRASRPRIPELDGLRGIAILLVLMFHYMAPEGPMPPGHSGNWHLFLNRLVSMGWSGVDLFFVLSGFLIGGILMDVRNSPNYFKTFYLRRFFRIAPVYYLWIAGYVLLAIFAGQFVQAHSNSGASLQLGWPIYAHFLFLQNLGVVHLSHLTAAWFLPLWSLAVEEQFYLIAPVIIWLVAPRKLAGFLILVVAGVPLFRLALLLWAHADPWLVYILMPTRADSLSVGMLAAILWRSASFRARIATHRGVLYLLIAVFTIGALAFWKWWPEATSFGMESAGFSWLALFYGLILVLVLAKQVGPFAAVTRMGWLRELGTVSYCMYIIHLAVNVICHGIVRRSWPAVSDFKAAAVTILAAFLTYGIAKISWIVLERPLLRRGHSFSY